MYLSTSTYIDQTVTVNYCLPLAIEDPFPYDCCPELDTSDPLTLTISFFSRLVFDPTYLTISLSLFPEYDWSKLYGDIKEAIPSDMPEPLCNDVDVRMMCDSDHAERRGPDASILVSQSFATGRYLTGFPYAHPLLRPRFWLSGLQYKLHLLGIPLSGPSYTSGGNKLQVTDSTKP
ncbi:hypothetical protein ACHAXA_009588 [Cyclostephanos tholiformis]|uniref:Uncharacterized protein n=1 Tax=Cyclostephanos tholiformis TaxID=382380 RepID=A0ABD3R2N4_9STRA